MADDEHQRPLPPAHVQRAVFIAVLSFLFFLAMMMMFYLRQSMLYFLLASAFLVVYIVTMISFVRMPPPLMPQTPHIEKHFTSGEVVRDVVIGMADGLTVPFALAAGLSGAVLSTGIIVTAGLAEIVAGSIAMGLGGYLAGRSDVEHYASEYKREIYEIEHLLDHEKDEVIEILETYGLTRKESVPIVESLATRPNDFADFMMRFELGLEKPKPKRALTSGATIGGAYILGGLIPLMPYILLAEADTALKWSVGITVVALFVFGYVKGKFTGSKPFKSALQTCLIGSVAAAAAFFIAKAIGG